MRHVFVKETQQVATDQVCQVRTPGFSPCRHRKKLRDCDGKSEFLYRNMGNCDHCNCEEIRMAGVALR